MFIKKEIAGSSLSAFSLCDLQWSCLRARKNLDYPFCVWNGGWKLFSSRVCSTLPSPWPMIIYFQLTDHTAFASFFLEGILSPSRAHQLNNLSFSIQLSISHKLFEVSARTSLLSAVPFLLVLLWLMHTSVSATRFRSFCIIQEYCRICGSLSASSL